jgi:hypothetical protein
MARRFAPILSILTVVLLFPCGCGGGGGAGELKELLARRSGEISSISYACITDDGERTYREEFELLFPDDYRYRFYEYMDGQAQLRSLMVQSGNDLCRVRSAPSPSGEASPLQAEVITNIPPLRCTGTYLALYHLLGNADYFQSMLALIEGGELEVAGSESVDGAGAYLLVSAEGLKPSMRIWLDRSTGLPLKKEITLGEGRLVVFRYEDVEENAVYADEPFPPDIAGWFGEPGTGLDITEKDGGCRPIEIENAMAEAGFSPLVPQVEGFELAAVYVREPAASDLNAPSEGSMSFPEGFRELYLVLRRGPHQLEIRQSPYDPQFTYYTTGMAALSGAFLTRQETWGEEAGGATYIAAMDCQEMRLVLGDIDLMVTGDLSREEMRSLAAQLKELAD